MHGDIDCHVLEVCKLEVCAFEVCKLEVLHSTLLHFVYVYVMKVCLSLCYENLQVESLLQCTHMF